MKVSPQWLREFVDYKVHVDRLSGDLTAAGIAVESITYDVGVGEAEDVMKGIKPGAIFEMDITTNRVDAMNHYGIARECSALYDLDLKPLSTKLPEPKPGAAFPIEIQEPQLCARYTARMIHGVKIGASPAHIVQRLHSLEAGSISNAVDASNYTLLEMGHPTHAFDLDLLEGGKIIVRKAYAGESLKTLDGVERKLHPEDLIIADAKKPVALAGVMGGFETMITERTKNVLIESAWFDPATVRRTSRRLGMHTDASHRFERGADWAATPVACACVAQLILESAGGALAGPESDAIAKRLERGALRLRTSEILRHLGQQIPESDILRILNRLGFITTKPQNDEYKVALPTWRLDVEREIDLIEEIARIYGYNNFKNTLPAFSGAVEEQPDAEKETKLRSRLLALGYDEAISMTFISAAEAKKFSPAGPVPIANPLSEGAAVMRTSLVPGMLGMMAHNLNRGNQNLRLFEAGHIYESAEPMPHEPKQICLGATGLSVMPSAHSQSRTYSFFDLKGDVEQLLGAFDCSSLRIEEEADCAYLQPGRAARALMNDEVVARFGQLHPEEAAARKLKQDIFIAEVFLETLYRSPLRAPRYQPLSQYPGVQRDFSFIFPEPVRYAAIEAAIRSLHLSEMQSLEGADMLRGKPAEKAGIPTGSFSILLRASFQSHERTLRDDEVAAWSQQIIKKLEALGGKLRA